MLEVKPADAFALRWRSDGHWLHGLGGNAGLVWLPGPRGRLLFADRASARRVIGELVYGGAEVVPVAA
jgi:hypothetical protein